MSLVKSRLFVSGLALAGLGAVALGYAAPHLSRAWQPDPSDRSVATQIGPGDASAIAVADKQVRGVPTDAPGARIETVRMVRVDAPKTAVRVDKESGKVAVRAPYTDVRVDPDNGRVRVRAPYVNLDIRW